MPHVEAGKLIPWPPPASRPAYLPGHPYGGRVWLPGFEALNWYAFVAPAEPLRRCWTLEPGNRQVLNDPGVKEALNSTASAPAHPRAELTAFMKKESAQWAATIKGGRLPLIDGGGRARGLAGRRPCAWPVATGRWLVCACITEGSVCTSVSGWRWPAR